MHAFWITVAAALICAGGVDAGAARHGVRRVVKLSAIGTGSELA